MRIGNDSLISAPLTLDDDYNFPPIWLGHIANYSIHITSSDTGTGSFKLQASCDNPQNNSVIDIQNWIDVDDSSTNVTGGDNVMWTVENAGYNWVRVVFTHSSGDFAVDTARFNVKGV